ncbi:conserved unknown protein [Ectocarpus siliculosus]|uniref:DNA ligase n=1 Tax=Ectocarpus siliculosus TaxID=2880 RepID=D8LFE0_ECTSI|nr:conserved unknown protein [Ectocarpus siliculosus]|eukprot:CBN75600.1 conserved unknown protein [Ectocarpus siliculosus]
MQKSITSFFGGPKDGAADPPSPPKPRPPSAKPSPKPKPKAAKKAPEPAATKKPKPRRVVDGDGEDEAKPASPSPAGTSNAEEKGNGESLSPEKNTAVAAGKRKQAAGEGAAEEEETAAAAAPRGGKAGDDELEGGEDAPAQKKPRRLRRLAEKKANAAAEDSDDDMFGAGAAVGEETAKGEKKSAAMDVVELGNDDDDGSGEEEAEEEAEPHTAGEEEEEEEEEEEAGEEEEDEDEEDAGEVEGEGAKKTKGASGTVASALMAGAKRASGAPPPKKKVKGSTAASLVIAKTEDLLAKASWKKGQPVPFSAVAEMFDRVEQTSKRLEIQEILRGFLCTVIALTPEDLVPCVYLACNQLAPSYEGMELGIGDMVLQKSIQGATGRSAKDIKAAAQKAGDLGEVAQHSTKSQGTLSFGQTIKALSARDGLERYRAIARVKGNSSGEDKINRIKKMLVSCKGLQAKYIIRGLQGKMRVGLTDTTVMVSLSHAAVTCPSEAVLAAEEAEKVLADQEREGGKADDDCGGGGGGGKGEGDERPVDATGEEKAGGSDDGKEGVAGEPAAVADKSGDGKDGGGGEEEDASQEEEIDGLIPVARALRDTPASHLEQRLELACQLVKQAYSECRNLDQIIKAILSTPLYRLQQACRLTPGVPVLPMLAKPTKSIGEVLQRLSGQEFTCEYKYDGVRAQVHHKEDGSLRFFSRNSKDSSSELPDLIPVMKDCVKEGVSSYVIDTEVVAYDRETGNLLPFQMLSTRGRKDVDAEDVKVKVIVEAFDMLYLNGQSLLQKPLKQRRRLLRSTFKEVDGRFRFATFMDHKEDGDTGPIEEFLSEAVKGNCEGLMVKTLTANSSYEPSKRSLNWLKLKKDYLQADGGGVGDSLDLVPIGAFFGKGKRTGKYGAYLLACYEPDREEYQSVCKIGTGFTDEILNSFWEELKEHTVEQRPRYYNVADSLSPDVWLAPHKVWEVKCADLSKSPVHKAAIGKIAQEPDRGISIRFPRLLREREDKDPEQATTSDQILDMYEGQDVVKSNAAGGQANNAADDDWEL